MTLDEYNDKIAHCNSVIKEMEEQRMKIRKEFADSLTAKCSEFVGKKVRIKHNPMYRNAVEAVGFFNGFVAGRFYPVMQVFKVRKNGTKSHNVFPSYELPAFDDLFTIEIVE